MLVKSLDEIIQRDNEMKDAEDYGYISCSLFLDGPSKLDEIEAMPEFEGYLRFLIRVSPDETPALKTEGAKTLYKKLYKEITEKEVNDIEFASVDIPEYEREEMEKETTENNTDEVIIDVESEEIRPAEEHVQEEESKEETNQVETPEQPQQTTIQQPIQNQNIEYQAVYQQPVYQTRFQKPVNQVFETPINISDRPMLQMIRNAAWTVGLETYFFQEPMNDLIKICYTSTDGINHMYLDDWLDPAGCYFPEPVIIPNKAVPILYQAVIAVNENTLRDYMSWKKNPMMNPQMNNYIVNYVPDRLITDVCYSTHQIVKNLDAANTHILKTSLISLFNFLDQNHPELAEIRWEFIVYESPDKFTLEPENIDSSMRGLIFYTSSQTMDVSVVFDNTTNEKIKVVNKSVDSVQSAVNATNALKSSLSKGNPAQTKKTINKKPTTRKPSSKKKSDEEMADAETVAASK